MTSFMLERLDSGWEVDEAIVNEEGKIVVIRFGQQNDPECIRTDKLLGRIQNSGRLSSRAVFYRVDNRKVKDFNVLYQLDDPCSVMIFCKNRPISLDLGRGRQNKIVWGIYSEEEWVQMLKTAYSLSKSAHYEEA